MGYYAKINILVLVFQFFATFVSAAGIVMIDSVTQFDYAKDCYEKNDYISAVVEFKKFISFFPEDTKVDKAKFLVGMSWYKGGEFGEAIKEFTEITAAGPLSTEAYFMLSRCHVASGNPVMGEIVLNNFIKITDNNSDKDRAKNRIGWIRFETAKWEKSRETFLGIGQDNREKYHVNELIQRLDKTGEIENKSPVIAGVSGIFPGAGYIYTHRYQDALVSFLLNGALIYAAYESFERENYALGGIISFVGFGFYSGSIYGSVSSAHKYNGKERRDFIRATKKEIPSGIQLGVLPDLNRKGFALAIRCQF